MLLRSVTPDVSSLLVHYLEHLLLLGSIDGFFFIIIKYKSSQIYEAFKQKYNIAAMLSSSPVLCWQVPRAGPAPTRTDVAPLISDTPAGKRQQAYKTEIIGGVVVHTPIQVIRGSCGCYGDEKREWGLRG